MSRKAQQKNEIVHVQPGPALGDDLIGRAPDEVVAAALGMSEKEVKRERERRKINPVIANKATIRVALFVVYSVHGLTTDEIACKLDTTRQNVYRMRTKLRAAGITVPTVRSNSIDMGAILDMFGRSAG